MVNRRPLHAIAASAERLLGEGERVCLERLEGEWHSAAETLGNEVIPMASDFLAKLTAIVDGLGD